MLWLLVIVLASFSANAQLRILYNFTGGASAIFVNPIRDCV